MNTHLREELLLHIAVTWPVNATELARRLARPKDTIHEALTALMQEGVVYLHNGALRAAEAQERIAATPHTQLRELYDQVLAETRSGASTRTATLVALAEAGCTDKQLLSSLLNATCNHPDDASIRSALVTVARARNLSDDELRILQAETWALTGNTHEVLSLTDPLLNDTHHPLHRRATLLAAGAHLQENRSERALALYTHVGTDEAGSDTTWAILAALAHGDLNAAHAWHEGGTSTGITNLAAGLEELATGLLTTITGTSEAALDHLAHSVSTLTPIGNDTRLPDTPAALAALVALSSGNPETAALILDRAIQTGLGGPAGTHRHRLLHAWALMTLGDLDASHTQLQNLNTPHQLSDRDRFLHASLKAALARRRSDIGEMRAAWQEVRALTFGFRITLFDLLPLGEIMVVAARLKDTGRARDLAADGIGILDRLGNPAVWSVPFHWHGVQAAFQSEDPEALQPHANALATHGATNTYAATLADAGNTWLAVLSRDTDFARVERSARALARCGHVWDGSRLASQAALQHPEREGALAMMQLAREISKEHTNSEYTRVGTTTLTTRELEVSRLVLDGQGYRAIGEQLFISPKTVEHHVARIRSRLGANSRAELLEKLHDIMTQAQ